ncbi:protein painting of fourth isoform X2 [Onthophagus taurus]|uniref:protein painting of fourth isoform X2 n=1 Tax=Onthophagus taurus TaxID=166361 RepID=UPI000C20C7CF|nr:protein painting of fourth isoform X2 [Onthophagus taurus]
MNEEEHLLNLQKSSQQWARRQLYGHVNPPLPPNSPPHKPPPPPPPSQRDYNSSYSGSKQNYPPSKSQSRYSQYKQQGQYNQLPPRYYPPPLPPLPMHSYNHYSPYTLDPQCSWNYQQKNYPNKNRSEREREEDLEDKRKNRKRKKPLSQNMVHQKNYTLEDAITALEVEKQYNKRYKNQSLILKFPDPELNKEIVAKLHPAIENVHFQQKSTPRFCFVNLKEDVDLDAVIKDLNTTPFGQGFITAELKNDQESEKETKPEDIDPCCLYIGNIAHGIPRQKLDELYPSNKRVDMGFARKMRFTRYAFISFHNAKDALEAFKKTHYMELAAKSLIVRFRRFQSTVGMPGEKKPQNSTKRKRADSATTDDLEVISEDFSNVDPTSYTYVKEEPMSDSEGGDDSEPDDHVNGHSSNHDDWKVKVEEPNAEIKEEPDMSGSGYDSSGSENDHLQDHSLLDPSQHLRDLAAQRELLRNMTFDL